MEIEHYHITPDEVSGSFTVNRISDFAEDDYCYLFVELPEGERIIIYNYPPEDGKRIRSMTLPASYRFDEKYHLVDVEQEAKDAKVRAYNAEMDRRNRIVAENVNKPWLPLHDGE